MADNAIEVFVAAYDAESGARDALRDLQRMENKGTIELLDVALVVHRDDGTVKIEETGDPSSGTWAKRGAIAGGLVGLIFPPSIIASAIVGAAGGGIWGKVRDKGFRDEDLKAIARSLTPGSSAIIAIAEDHVIERLQDTLADYRRVGRHTLSDEAVAAIVADVREDQAER
jgi:uncharacterized membrane protein